jgi:surface polysaccharide O-acyltransferase-like enzyme
METKIKIIAFDYLRSFIILLVLIYHSVVAYTPFYEISPLTDDKQWLGFNFIVWFNDSFFMALLFFISGLFVWQSLKHKGIKIFLQNRLARLGIPFILITFVAYYINLEAMAGHLWFLWVLLEFNLLIAILYKFLPKLNQILQSNKLKLSKNPFRFCVALIIVSTLAYLPMAIPFGFQERIFFYLVYFIFGVWLGAQGIDNTIFKSEGRLIKYWWAWLSMGILIFIIRNLFGLLENDQAIMSLLIYPISSAIIALGVIATFLKFTKKNIPILDNLSANAYGIYIIHYPFVIYLQYLLLSSDLHAIYKALIVFLATLTLSWESINIIRRIPIIRKII